MEALPLLIVGLFQLISRVTAAIDLVVVSENGYDVPRTVIPQAIIHLRKTNPDIGSYRDVVVHDAMTEQEICKEIMGGSTPPSLLIDTTLRPLQTESKVSARVKKIVRGLGIPTVSATYGRGLNFPSWETLSDVEREYLINVPPPGEMISQSVRAISKLQSLPTVSVLYDDTFVMDHKLSTLLQNLAVKSVVRYLPSGSEKDIRNITQQYKQTEMANFFVLASLATMGKLLSAVQSLNMFQDQYSWVLITKEDIYPACPTCNGTILFLKPEVSDKARFETINEHRFPYSAKVDTAFYFDLVEMVLKAVLDETKNGRWPTLSYPQCQASLTEAQRGERSKIKLSTALQQNPFNGAFGKFVIRSNDNAYQEIKMPMFKMGFSVGGQKTQQNVANVVCKSPLPDITMLQAQTNLKSMAAKLMYRVVTVLQPPFVMKRPGVEGKAAFYGYCIDLLNHIKDIIKFDYVIYESPDGLFGNMNDKMEWNGMMNELIEDRADIALGPISVMAERETVVDFTVPYYDLVGISILMKKPVVQASLFKFLTVLENNVWGCILGAYFFTSFLMYLFDRLSPYSYHNNREKYKDDDEKRDFNIKECMWFCMTSLTPQGGGEAPRNLSGRLVAATWWLFGFIIIASYTANLAAFLTVSRLDSPIESLDDLSKQYKIKYSPQNGSSSMTYFERMAHIEERFYEIWKNMSLDDTLNETERAKLAVWDYPVSDKYTKIWWTMKEGKDMPETFEEGVSRVQASEASGEGFAFIADSTQVKYATMTNCDLVQIGSEFSRKPLALAVQQGSQLKDQLSSAILKLLNQRKLESLKEAWWNKNPEKKQCDDNAKQSEGISIQNIGGVFIVIFIGVVLAIITLAIEYWYYRQKRKSTRVVAVKEYGSHNKDPIKR